MASVDPKLAILQIRMYNSVVLQRAGSNIGIGIFPIALQDRDDV